MELFRTESVEQSIEDTNEPGRAPPERGLTSAPARRR
jgi:hypothetical protein